MDSEEAMRDIPKMSPNPLHFLVRSFEIHQAVVGLHPSLEKDGVDVMNLPECVFG